MSDLHTALHILRNPHGHSEIERRGTQLWAAAELERLAKENAVLRADNAEWIKANGPGGWVDALRVGAERYAFCKTLEGQVEFITVIRNKGAAHLDAALDSARADASLEQAILERDNAEEAVSEIYFRITGKSPEWSNTFGHRQAIEEIVEDFDLVRAAAKQSARVEALQAAVDEVCKIDALNYDDDPEAFRAFQLY